ncbi:MAG: hypothetical protein FD123_2459 [Bacteroidetes bacterium]|nr:MAG: hypothetical protein FD123_2459 [Bacteroidota bacterium]
MAKAQNKTQKTDVSVENFLAAIKEEGRRKDCIAIARMMKQVTRQEPKMWGASMVGFGEYHYKYESGREGDMFEMGFSPRKQNLTLYLTPGWGKYPEDMKRLGKCKSTGSCLYINKLEDVDVNVLKGMMEKSAAIMKNYKKTGKM